MSIIFAKPDKRTQWEQVFSEAKQKLGKILYFRSQLSIANKLINSFVIGKIPRTRIHILYTDSQDQSWSPIYLCCSYIR